jgi:hypothetical protein
LLEVFVVRRVSALCLLSLVLVAGCGNDSPTAPTPPPPSATRVMVIEGNMAFGDVGIGASVTRELRIYNTGNEALNVTGMTLPSSIVGAYASSWTNGTIAPGASTVSTIRFTPTAAQDYNGTLTITANQTSGPTTATLTGRGVFPPRPTFSRSGVGVTVFDMPVDVQRVRIIGTYTGSCQNFIVHLRGRSIVNEILGSCAIGIGQRYDGTHQTNGGGTVEVLNASGVSWSFEELR